MTPWWNGQVRNIEIIVPECSPTCSASEIDEALGPPFSNENWRAVKVGNVLYVHSGYGIVYGPELGDFLKRMHKAGNTYNLRLGDIWYTQKTNVVLGREEVGGSVNLAELFDIEQEDIFILTCWYGYSTGADTPKLIEHLTITH